MHGIPPETSAYEQQTGFWVLTEHTDDTDDVIPLGHWSEGNGEFRSRE